MRPATTTQDTDRGSGNDRPSGKFVEDDDRSHGQRRHDASGTVLDRLLRRDDNPDAGGTPATLIISMSYQDFITQIGVAHYSDGTPVPVKTALRLADQAEIAWCFTDAKGAVLDLYRTRRIASKDQTLALYARDGGCSFPGCSVEPQWCERHHIIPWWLGGVTNLNNLTLLCAFHHHQFERRGWQCRMKTGYRCGFHPSGSIENSGRSSIRGSRPGTGAPRTPSTSRPLDSTPQHRHSRDKITHHKPSTPSRHTRPGPYQLASIRSS